jgi:hypothetical protein
MPPATSIGILIPCDPEVWLRNTTIVVRARHRQWIQ